MDKDITMNDIVSFKEQYTGNKKNVEIENKIRKLGIMKSSMDINKKYSFKFNIEVPEMKIYNQLDSHQCNIYAFLRVVKDIMRKTTDLDVKKLDLSANYINFFDRLEKANVLYNVLINCEDLSLEKINQDVNRYIGSFGTFYFCKNIVNKYGLVTTDAMSEVNKKYDDNLAIELLRNKIKSDAEVLLNIKSLGEKQKKKKDLMYEVYQFLSKIYGQPPISFKFYGSQITPIQFKNQYLKDYLDDYVTVTTFSKEAFFSSYAYVPSIYLGDNEKIVKTSTNQVKEAIVKQLKDEVSVWISIEESTTLDYSENILDDELYNFNDLLNIKNVSKNKSMALDLINYDHAMCITGALVENGNIKQFRVDNSFGNHGKYKGQLIMTSSFLENYVITAIINKKYL